MSPGGRAGDQWRGCRQAFSTTDPERLCPWKVSVFFPQTECKKRHASLSHFCIKTLRKNSIAY